MKKLACILLLLVPFSAMLSQNAQQDSLNTQPASVEQTLSTDTLSDTLSMPKPPTLRGTTIIPYSKRNIRLRNQGLQLMKLSSFENCNSSLRYEDFKKYPKLEKAVTDSSWLVIEVSVADYCIGISSAKWNSTATL
ncbi:MAG: hypothetical protein GXO48_01665 [Chlorobi bacterium]|nr:hypothetical protein [Chlorobiota bacterium]